MHTTSGQQMTREKRAALAAWLLELPDADFNAVCQLWGLCDSPKED